MTDRIEGAVMVVAVVEERVTPVRRRDLVAWTSVFMVVSCYWLISLILISSFSTMQKL